MPKVKYSVGKGLHQVGGSGIDLVGIGAWEGQKMANGGAVTTAATQLAEEDSGKVYILGVNTGNALKLPTPSVNLPGWNIKAVLTGALDGDVTIIRHADDSSSTLSGTVIGGTMAGGSGIGANIASNILTFDQSNTLVSGDYVEIFCAKSTASAALFVANVFTKN